MKILTAAAALLALGIFPAYAHSAEHNNPNGPYVGVGWGQLNLDLRNLNDVGTATSNIVKADENAWKLFGGWRINPYLAIEAAYIDFGTASGRFTGTGSNGNYTVNMSGFSPTVIGSIPLGPVELFAKAGSYFYDVEVQADFDNPGPNVDSTHSRNDLLLGGGLGFTIGDRFHLRAEYESIKLKNASNSDAIWLSGAWRF